MSPPRALRTRSIHVGERCHGGTRTSSRPTGSSVRLTNSANQVDDGTYEIVGPNTLVIPYLFEEGPPILVTFHYRIRGNTIVFDPVIPTDCSTSRCREAAAWSITVALPGKTWRRVG